MIAAIEKMEEMGGSFVKALARAWRLADPKNKTIIEKAFAHLFEKYSKL